MTFPRGLFAILITLFCASSLPAWAGPGYRLVALDDGSAGTMVFDLNRRGEVVGIRTVDGQTHAFRWRAGTFTDLHDTIDPASFYTQASAINDFSTIVGDKATDFFEGFQLRGGQVSPITVNGGAEVFPLDINDREQIIVEAGNGSYLLDGANVQPLEGLPSEAEPTHAVAINERGAIAGNTFTSAGSRAVLWQDGAVMDLGVVPGASASFAYALNDRNQVVGIVSIGNASHAMRWSDGVMTLLPRLSPDEAASSPSGINNWGVIVGGTTISLPQFHQTATLWFGNHVVELDSLVRADDPLKPFVHLRSAEQINDRGDIVVSGVDSRTNARIVYFMTLFGN
jgi:probable HAF family extracellular repeat protein